MFNVLEQRKSPVDPHAMNTGMPFVYMVFGFIAISVICFAIGFRK